MKYTDRSSPEFKALRTSQKIEIVRSLMGDARSILSEERHTTKNDRLHDAEGLLTCGISSLHNDLERQVTIEVMQDDHKFGPSLPFHSRGLGLDVVPCCFICHSKERSPGSNHYLNNMSAFIKSREDGATIREWFGDYGQSLYVAHIDYRESEPKRIQFKVGACDLHVHALQWLSDKTRVHGVIREQDVKGAIEFKRTAPPVRYIKTLEDFIEVVKKGKVALIASIEHRKLLAGPGGLPSMKLLTEMSPDPLRWPISMVHDLINAGLHTVEAPEDLLL